MIPYPVFSLTHKLRCEQPQKVSAPPRTGFSQYPANAPIEDRVAFGNFGKFSAVAVLDGHGGWQVAEKLRASLPAHVRACMEKTNNKTEALREAFRQADTEVRSLVAPAYALGFSKLARVGACGLIVIVDDKEVFVANAGDCKGVLIGKDASVVALNLQNNANEPEEQARLRKLHPEETDVVKCKREWTEKVPNGWFRSGDVTRYSGCYVKGLLQPTKAFGDFYLKEERLGFDFDRQRTFVNPANPKSFPYITSDPDITSFPRSVNDRLIVLGSDGLWDELSETEVAKVATDALNQGATPEEISAQLVEAALAKAASSAKVRVEDLKRLPQGRDRRVLHDDISVAVLVL